jgi:hypothetical protein
VSNFQQEDEHVERSEKQSRKHETKGRQKSNQKVVSLQGCAKPSEAGQQSVWKEDLIRAGRGENYKKRGLVVQAA